MIAVPLFANVTCEGPNGSAPGSKKIGFCAPIKLLAVNVAVVVVV